MTDLIEFANSSASDAEISKKIAKLVENTNPTSVDILKKALLRKPENSYVRNGIAPLLCLALLQKGKTGIQALLEVLPKSPGAVFPQNIIFSIWRASFGELSPGYTDNYMPALPPLLKIIPEETALEAKNAFKKIVFDSRDNPNLFQHLLNFMQEELSSKHFDNEIRVSADRGGNWSGGSGK